MGRHLVHELKVTVRLAHEAGAAIMAHYQTDLPVDRKDGDEPVTAADRPIAAGLREAFPGVDC